MKDLNRLNKQEQEEFLNSFDQILCDVDGVLWLTDEFVPGAKEAIDSLRNMGKKIAFVSNNCSKPLDTYFNHLNSAGFSLDKNELIIPSLAIVSHLQKAKFSKEIYLIGMSPLRNVLEKAGFKIAEFGPDDFGDSVAKFIGRCVLENDTVGAVIADFDVNVSVLKLQRAVTHLRRPEVMFICAGGDKRIALKKNQPLIGPGYFQNILEDMTGRKPIRLGKPSTDFNDFVKEKCGIKDPSRVLFIGDSILDDMAFASHSGYKKLLVFSGLEDQDCVQNWTYPEDYKPDYYGHSLKSLLELIISGNFINKP